MSHQTVSVHQRSASEKQQIKQQNNSANSSPTLLDACRITPPVTTEMVITSVDSIQQTSSRLMVVTKLFHRFFSSHSKLFVLMYKESFKL